MQEWEHYYKGTVLSFGIKVGKILMESLKSRD